MMNYEGISCRLPSYSLPLFSERQKRALLPGSVLTYPALDVQFYTNLNYKHIEASIGF